MIIVEWSAVTGYVGHRIDASDLKITPIDVKISSSVQRILDSQNHHNKLLKSTLGVPRHRASKGNHKWRLSVVAKNLKKKDNGKF
jgi:hypothetical protein